MPYSRAEDKTEIKVVGVKPIPWTLIGMIIAGTVMIVSSAYVR